MKPSFLHSYLLWRSSVEPDSQKLASSRLTASVSLLPVVMVGLVVYGWYAGLVLGVAVFSAFIVDLIAHRFNGHWIFINSSGTRDGTWLLAGLLVGLLMPPAVPLWVPAVGGALAIAIGKHWLSVDNMPLLQPAAVALLLLHIIAAPFMHPSANVTRNVTSIGGGPERVEVGEQKIRFAKAGAVEAGIKSIEDSGDGNWKVKGLARNGRAHEIRDIKLTVRFLDSNRAELKAVESSIPEAVEPGDSARFSVQLAALPSAASFELQFTYTETVPKWPILTRPVVPPKSDEEKGLTPRFVKQLLEGDITEAIDKEQYLDQLFAGKRPVSGESKHVEAIFGPRPLDLVKDYPDQRVSGPDLAGKHRYDGLQLFLGAVPGPIGGGSAMALILGILLVLFTRTISWAMPFAALITMLCGLTVMGDPNASIHLLSSYTLLGLFYLAANPVTVPRSLRGKLIAGILIGLLELALRKLTPLSEATFISVIAIQCLSIVFDQYIAPPREPEPKPSTDPGISSLRRL